MRFLVVRSLGPTAVSASSISRFGLWLGLGAGVASSAASGDGPLGSRERGRLRRAFNDFHRLTGSRREHGLDGLDGLLDLLVRHLLYAVRVLYLHLARHQQRKRLLEGLMMTGPVKTQMTLGER